MIWELSKNQSAWDLDFLALAQATSLSFSRLDRGKLIVWVFHSKFVEGSVLMNNFRKNIIKLFPSQFYMINERDPVPVKVPQIMMKSLLTEILKISFQNNLHKLDFGSLACLTGAITQWSLISFAKILVLEYQ